MSVIPKREQSTISNHLEAIDDWPATDWQAPHSSRLQSQALSRGAPQIKVSLGLARDGIETCLRVNSSFKILQSISDFLGCQAVQECLCLRWLGRCTAGTALSNRQQCCGRPQQDGGEDWSGWVVHDDGQCWRHGTPPQRAEGHDGNPPRKSTCSIVPKICALVNKRNHFCWLDLLKK